MDQALMHAAKAEAGLPATVRSRHSSRTGLVATHDRLLLGAACTLLALAFLGGGSSQQSNITTPAVQLLSLPVLLLALHEGFARGVLQQARASLTLCALIVAVPLLQMLPLPEALWLAAPARQALQRDLAAVGATAIDYRWTLSPGATERDVLALLPGVALFVAALALGGEAHRRLFWLVMALVFGSLLLAIAQVGAGQDSVLNPYPQWAPAMGGVFANPNHQAAGVAIAMVLAIALVFDTRSRARHGEPVRGLVWIFAALIGVFVVAVPLIGSRAGPVLCIVSAVIVALSSGLVSAQRVREQRGAQAAVAVAVAVLLVGVYAAFNWTTGAKIDVMRQLLTQQTAAIGATHAPLGGGFGAFVPLFDQGVDETLLGSEYINAAHNDYVQLWLEGGIAALFAMAAALIWYAAQVRRLFKLHAKSSSRRRGFAAATALLVILLHSWVDYPLRTPALLAVFAMMAGVLARSGMGASASDSTREREVRMH